MTIYGDMSPRDLFSTPSVMRYQNQGSQNRVQNDPFEGSQIPQYGHSETYSGPILRVLESSEQPFDTQEHC